MGYLRHVLKVITIFMGLSVCILPAYSQVEVDQNNNVDLRSGNLIVDDDQVGIKPQNSILSNFNQDFIVDGSSYFSLGNDGVLLKSFKNTYSKKKWCYWDFAGNYRCVFYVYSRTAPALVPSSKGYPSSGADIGRENNPIRNVYTDDLYYRNQFKLSDSLYKKDIDTINGERSINQIMQLQPVKFRYNDSFYDIYRADSVISVSDSFQTRLQRGFIAQQVQNVVPQTVIYREKEGEERGTYTFSQEELIPILTKALQEQQQAIESLQSQVDSLQSQVNICCPE